MVNLLDPCSILRVQTWDENAALAAGVEEGLGIAWPRHTGAVASGRADVLCIAPTDWLVMASNPDAASLLQGIEGALKGSAYRAATLSQALARIQIEGSQARSLLAKGCALDLHPHYFAAGRSARTRFAGLPVIVRCTQSSTFVCIVTASYRDYLLAWLNDAALEFAAST